MKKYIKPIIEVENLQMLSSILDVVSQPVGMNEAEGTFDDAKHDSFGDLFGGLFN